MIDSAPKTYSTTNWHTELASRRAAVWNIVQENKCDVALILGSAAQDQPFRYLTNFLPIFGDIWAILSGTDVDAMTCVLNFNWQLIEARAASGLPNWHGIFDSPPLVAELLAGHHPRRVGVIGLHRLPVPFFVTIKAAVPEATFVDIGAQVALLRRIKNPLEVEIMRAAGRIADAAFDVLRGTIRPGMTQQEISAELIYSMQSLSADDFPTAPAVVVISGNDNPIPIRSSTPRKIEGAGYKLIHRIGHGLGLAASFEWPSLDTDPTSLEPDIYTPARAI